MATKAPQKKHLPVVPLSEKLCFSIDDFALINGICRQSVYNEINAKRLRTKKVGKRRLIPREEADRWRLQGVA